jgi:hypothetical protein
MKPSKSFNCLLLALALAAGCQSDSPTEPGGSSPPVNPIPPTPVTTYSITLTPNPSSLSAGSATPSNVTVRVTRTDTGQPPPDLTQVTVSTTLGEFGQVGSGLQTVNLQLVNGQAQVALFPGQSVGTATLRAQVGGSAAAANVQIGQQATFFISSISPGVGSPQGGEEVTINGGGFDGPVRVTFNGATAQVLSVSANRVRVRTPSAQAAGVTVGPGQAVPVSVAMTINLNEPGQLSDTLASGFTFALGGGGILQPQVLSISPSSGTNDGGTRVTIVGDGFEQPVQVFFGQGSTSAFTGVEGVVESVTRTRIIAITPAARGFGQDNVNQTVSLMVRNVNTGFSTVAGQFYRYGSNVLITSMGPGAGSYLGGTRVTLFGQGFDEPVTVALGNNPAIAQQVLSVTGSEIVFMTSGVPVTQCPVSGVITAQGVSVTNIDTGDSDTASNLAFSYIVPLPQIFGIAPPSGPISGVIVSEATITGMNFAEHVQVLFGDATNGAAATVVSSSGTSIRVRIPTPAPGFVFTTEPCDANGDGVQGTRNLPTAISVTVRNLDGTGCAVSLPNAFTIIPSNACNEPAPPPPITAQCADGVDNDGDTLIDFGAGATNDPQCSSAADNNEGS